MEIEAKRAKKAKRPLFAFFASLSLLDLRPDF
jgi:hypothetical protein